MAGSKLRSRAVGACALALALFSSWQPVRGAPEPFPDFYLPGSLSVTLDPDGSWQIVTEKDGSGNWVTREANWRPSGAVEAGLAPGRYTVVFRAPRGYREPDPLEMEVFGGIAVSRSVSLSAISVYGSAAEVPPQEVRLGDTLKFLVEGGASLAGVPPGRSISFVDGVFSYRPADGEGEKEQFAVTLSGPGGVENRVVVTPQPRLPAEASVLAYRGDFLPIESSAERKAYLTVLVEERTRSAQEGPLNVRGDLRARSVTISGARVVFAAGHENGLLDDFGYDQLQHPVDDIESLAIHADQVVIRGRLHLPETDVTIHARELFFEDQGGTAQIITTPLKAPGTSMNGARGHDAGDVNLQVGSVHAPGNARRLVLKGGAGQDPVVGRNGLPLVNPAATSYTTYTGSAGVTCPPLSEKRSGSLPANTVYYRYDRCCAGCTERAAEGTNATLRSGDSATANGVPGNGGDGGVLTCPFELQGIADVSRGTAGPAQPARFGSAGDRPYNAVKAYNYYNCFCDWDSWEITTRWRNVAGDDHPATSAPGPNPVNGEVRAESLPFAWLHPVAIRSLLAFARDVYLNGYPDESRRLLTPYVEALKAHADRPAEHAADLAQLEDEIGALLYQIDSHLDFFGFPAGWVPMLSFEVTLGLFQDEVKAAGDILYLSHYLSLEADRATNKRGALERMRSELAEEIQQFQGLLDASRARLSTLSIQARGLEREISETRLALDAREDDLRNQAKLNAALKKAFRVAGNVLPLIPVGQPALGLAGAGFTAASKFNEQSALDSSIEATNLAHVYLGQHMDQQLQDFQTAMCANPAECELKAAFLLQQKALEGLDASMVAVNQVLQEAKTWESDVDKEVQILAAEDPRHKDLVKRVRDLNARKKLFAEEMVVALNEAMKLTSGINQGFLALDSLNRDSVRNSARIDQEAFAYIKEMGLRAKERLLRFQYYLVQAYHYRTLRPYHALPGGDQVFQLKDIFEHFEDEFFTQDFSQPDILDPDQSPSLVDLYTDQVREVIAAIADHLVAEPPEQTQTLNVELTAEELARLNRWDDSLGENPEGDLSINLVERGGLFDQRQENLRVFELRVHTMDVAPAPGTSAANVTVFVRHSGDSLVSSRGDVHRFNHYRTLRQAPIIWRGIYDRVQGTHSSPQPSAASNSLLETLLGGLEGQQIPRDLLLYSRPSAWADLAISKETLGSQEMLVQRLVLQLKVDFSEKEAQAELEVSAVGLDGEPLAPTFLLSHADVNSRSDGRGSFRRFYEPGESVTLRAQEVCGSYLFDRWVDRRGETASTEPVLLVNLPFGQNATVSRFNALYRYSPGGGGPGTPFERGDANSDGLVDISDGITILNALFTGGEPPSCQKTADANDDSLADISDAIYLLASLFTGGSPVPPPRGACGTDPTPDLLTCASYPCE